MASRNLFSSSFWIGLFSAIFLLSGVLNVALASPSVNVVSPNGGECFTPGSTVVVSWSGNEVDHAAIAYRKDSDGAPPPYTSDPAAWNIAHPVSGSSYSWATPPSVSTSVGYKIWIEGHNSSHGSLAADSSDNPFGFAVSCGGSVTVNGGDTTAPPAITTSDGGTSGGGTLLSTSTTYLEGVVTDPSGAKVSGAFVQARRSDAAQSFGAMTASDGSFRFGVEAGTYIVELFPPQGRYDLLKPPAVTVGVSDGQTRNIALQFTAGSKTVTGKVLFSSGLPVTDAEVGAYSGEFKQWVSAFTDGSGSYALGLSGGRWQMGMRPRNPLTASWSWDGKFVEVEFVKDATAETRVVNLTVAVSDAKVVVRTRDQNGNVLPGVSVAVDTVSESTPTTTLRPPPLFKVSDANGAAEFTLRGETYYVRGFAPPTLGYFNPGEQAVSVSGGETREIALTFRKAETVTTATLRGITKFEDGSAAPEAFVGIWSQSSQESRSNSSGEFSFTVPLGSTWHLKAGKIVNNLPYMSSELTVNVSVSPVFVEVILERGEEALAPPVTVSRAATEQVVVRAEDGAQVIVPAGAAAVSGNINVAVQPTIEVPSQAAAAVVGTAYDIKITDAAGRAVTQLTTEVEISFPYDEAELKAQGISEDAVIPSFFDEAAGAWKPCENYSIDKDRNVAICRVKHLTRFALIAAADATPPAAPSGLRVLETAPGEVAISWTNPASDFSHAKIYRSTIMGTLGKIAVNNIVVGFAKDVGLTQGTTYYYTVRAVDPAGNESSNLDQVSITIGAGVLPPGQAVKLEILRNLSVGASGEDVKILQELLLKEGVYPEGLITGFFGNLTKQAVIRFQEKYAQEILVPAELAKGNGFVGALTRKKINSFITTGAPSALPPGQAVKAEILRNLKAGASGEDVKALQELLLKEGVYPEGLITGFFGELTKQAVIRFQEKYAEEILKPAGLSNGTGFVGSATRAKINQLLK